MASTLQVGSFLKLNYRYYNLALSNITKEEKKNCRPGYTCFPDE